MSFPRITHEVAPLVGKCRDGRLGAEHAAQHSRRRDLCDPALLHPAAAESDALNEGCASIVVNVIEWGGVSVRGFVYGQSTALEATKSFEDPSDADLAACCEQVRELFGPLREAALRNYSSSQT
jgi:hypothetical protein